MTMKYYASHYLWHAGQNQLFRMQRIGLDASSHVFLSMESLEEEVRQTQWLNGLIIWLPVGQREGKESRFLISVSGCPNQ